MKSAFLKITFCTATLLLVILLFKETSFGAGPTSTEKLVIKKIEITGNTFFSAKRIKEQMSLRQNRWYNLFKKQRLYKWKMENDRLAIDSLYHINGFLQARSSVNYQADTLNQATLKVNIFEGVQTKIKGFTVTGGLESLASKQNKELSVLKPNVPLNLSGLGVLAFNLKTVYANNGYPYCGVKTSIALSQDTTSAQIP